METNFQGGCAGKDGSLLGACLGNPTSAWRPYMEMTLIPVTPAMFSNGSALAMSGAPDPTTPATSFKQNMASPITPSWCTAWAQHPHQKELLLLAEEENIQLLSNLLKLTGCSNVGERVQGLMAMEMTTEESSLQLGEQGSGSLAQQLQDWLRRQKWGIGFGAQDPDAPPIPFYFRPAQARFGFTGGGVEARVSEIEAPTIFSTYELQASSGSNEPMIGNPVLDDNITYQVYPHGWVTGRGGGDGVAVQPGWVTGRGGIDAVAVHPSWVTGREGGDAVAFHPGWVFRRGGVDAVAVHPSWLTGRGGFDAVAVHPGWVTGRGGVDAVHPGWVTGRKGGDAAAIHPGWVIGRGGDAPGVHAGSVTGRGGGDAPEIQLNDDMLRERRSTARATGQGGFEVIFVDEAGGRFFAIPVMSQQQGSAAAAHTTDDGTGGLGQRALESAFGGIVPLCYTILDDTLKGACPGYINAAIYAGLGLIAGFTFIGLISKKKADAAVRVVASTSVAAMSIAVVYIVSENVYIKSICGIIGAVTTFATMAINW
ncbi:hypothetical protein ACQ4PT_004844 [Festuca glaucescens]